MNKLLHYMNNGTGFVKSVTKQNINSLLVSQAQNNLTFPFQGPTFQMASTAADVDKMVYTRRIKLLGIMVKMTIKVPEALVAQRYYTDVSGNLTLLTYKQTSLAGVTIPINASHLLPRTDVNGRANRYDVVCAYNVPLFRSELDWIRLKEVKPFVMRMNLVTAGPAGLFNYKQAHLEYFIPFYEEYDIDASVNPGDTFSLNEMLGNIPVFWLAVSSMCETEAAANYKENVVINSTMQYFYQDVGDTNVF